MTQQSTFLFLIVALSWGIPVAAQTFVKEGKVCLRSNSMVTIQGQVHNQGTIINEGTISLTGDWNNVSSYVSEAGTIALTGTDMQLFSHNNQSVYSLTIANPKAISITSDVRIDGKLALLEGIVTPDTEVKLILSENAIVEGGDPKAYVNGKMYQTGLGTKFYPIGKNGQYAPITLAQVSGAQPVIGVEFYDKSLPAQSPSNIELTEDKFFWNFISASGRFDGSPIVLDMPVSNHTFFEEDKLIIAGSNNLEEEFKTLDRAKVQVIGDRYIFSSSLPVQSRYITIGQELLDIEKMMYIPNVLSPLAPHSEDRTIKVYSKSIVDNNFQWTIWDRWGHKVYTTTSYEEASATGWQGNYQKRGEALPGIYKYLLQGTLESGQTFSKTGNIVLYK